MIRKSNLSKKNLLSIEDLSIDDINQIFDLSEKYIKLNKKEDKKNPVLKGKTLINLFFENSTRTRTSFELAGKRLGADVANIQSSSSSVSKGESLIDTAASINAMKPDFITIRHPESGATKLMAKYVNCSVINGGDGSHEHPTQALLDVFVIKERLKKLKNVKVAICGDILHSRVARSNISLLNKMGAKVRIVAPPTLIPKFTKNLDVEIFNDMEEGIKGVDVIMMLRLQKERMNGVFIPSIREYFHLYAITRSRLKLANKGAFVMHPGPINRGLEIESQLVDSDEDNVILEQVETGVAIRQAILELLS